MSKITTTNALPTAHLPRMADNPFDGKSGEVILAAVKVGKRNPTAFSAAIDEMDRRVLNRMREDKPFTAPIVAAMAILDKRGIVHAGPIAKDAPVLTQREKDTVAEVMLEARTEPTSKKVTSKARQEARSAAEQEATALRKEAWNLRIAKRQEGEKITYAEACALVGVAPAKG